MSYTGPTGYMSRRGLGAAGDVAPIHAGKATTDGVLSYASLWAASVMRQMAAVPEAQRLDKMESVLNGMWPGMGSKARRDYLRLMRTRPASDTDQIVFDAIRLSFANRIADFTQEQLAKRPGGMSGSGLGDSVADIRATGCMISGIVATGTSTVSMFQASPDSALTLGLAAQGGVTGGCDVAAIEARGRAAALLAGATAAGTTGAMVAAAAREAAFLRYGLMAGGLLGTILIAAIVVKKM